MYTYLYTYIVPGPCRFKPIGGLRVSKSSLARVSINRKVYPENNCVFLQAVFDNVYKTHIDRICMLIAYKCYFHFLHIYINVYRCT